MTTKQKILASLLLLSGVIFSSVVTSLIVHHSLTSTVVINGKDYDVPTSFASMSAVRSVPTDFTVAAEKSVNSVVHVKTKMQVQQYSGGNSFNDPFFEYFFGRPSRPQQQQREPQEQPGGSGSGVILSSDGYIVTNNHVIDKASSVEVTLNDKRTFAAKVVGVDPTTDIALLKIEATDLQIMPLGNSDLLKVGEWVLAVGNPFNLTSTVTAGIVSAKARNINILTNAMKIESFIQTDAAINPGNSGGALVNTAGELIGINTAIASQTGSYAGYAFAVPVSIVSKVVADLKEYGAVQRGVLGVEIRDISSEFAKEKSLTTLEGAYVAKVVEKGAAGEAGIKEGDIINQVGEVKVKSVAELQEQVSRYRPGDKVKVGVLRGGKDMVFSVELKNRAGNTSIVTAVDMTKIGAKFEPISDKQKASFRIRGGLQVTSVEKAGRFAKAGIQKGYIIIKANNKNVYSDSDLNDVYESVKNSSEDKVMFLTGLYPNGQLAYYAVDLNE